MDTLQLQLLPDEPVLGVLNDVPLSLLPDDLHGDPPNAAMVEGVRRLGVLQPICLINPNAAPLGEGDIFDGLPFERRHVAFGRRRIRAARLAGLATIPALIFPAGWTPAAVLSLVENEQRRPNPVADFLAIEELVDGHHNESDICDATGLTAGTVRARLRLRRLVPPLKDALIAGRLRVNVAEAASKLSEDLQAKLVLIYSERGSLSAQAVRDVSRAASQSAAEGLPDDLFETVDTSPSLRPVVTLLGEVMERLPDDAPPSYVKSAHKLLNWLREREEADQTAPAVSAGLELVHAA